MEVSEVVGEVQGMEHKKEPDQRADQWEVQSDPGAKRSSVPHHLLQTECTRTQNNRNAYT